MKYGRCITCGKTTDIYTVSNQCYKCRCDELYRHCDYCGGELRIVRHNHGAVWGVAECQRCGKQMLKEFKGFVHTIKNKSR